ncbi:carboxypeptidase regulatory-like domain-containing protein [Pyxidicoccus sp. 3LG]
MRGWIVGAVIAGVLTLLTWRLLGAAPPEVARETTPAPHAATSGGLPRTSPPTPAATAGLSIRGTVVDALGHPVVGARISASWPRPDETLSELPCPRDAAPSTQAALDEPSRAPTLPECLFGAGDLIMQLLLAREGEAPVHAEAVSAEDGTFVLEGLPEGPQALWAFSERGAGVRMGVPAGSQGVELVLQSPMRVQGRVQGDGGPLAGAAVTVVSLRQTRFFDTSTDAEGRFRVDAPPDERYLILVSKEGWAPELVRSDLLRHVETLEVRMHRPRSLSGRVVSHGAAVQGVEVLADEVGTLPGRKSPRATTDAEGRFTLELETSRYALTAAHGGRYALALVELRETSSPEVVLELGTALHVEGTVSDDAGRPVAGARVKLISGRLVRKTLEAVTLADGRYRMGPVEEGLGTFVIEAQGQIDLSPEEELTLAPDVGPWDFTLARAASITGRVADEEGRPVPGAPLFLEMTDDTAPENLELRRGTLSDEDGRFVVDARQPGDYRIAYRGRHFVEQSVPVKAPASDLHLTLSAGGTVEGTLVDAKGLPLERFRVDLLPLDREGDSSRRMSTSGTDAQGRFTRQGVPPGRYRVSAEQVADSVDRRTWTDVEVRAGTVSKAELRLPEERPLEGVVVDTTGQPVEGVAVRAIPVTPGPDGQMTLRCMTGGPSGVSSDAKGRFVLRLGRFKHLLTASKAGHSLHEDSTGELLDGFLRIEADVAQVRLVLARKSHVRGRLVGPDGAPILRFTVDHQPVESRDGTFAIPNHAEPGTRSVIFAAEGLPSTARKVMGGTGMADVDLGEIRMERGRSLRGQVLDAETGAPVPEAFVSVSPNAPGEHAYTHVALASELTDEEGAFTLDSVEPRALVLHVGAPARYRTLSVPVEAHHQEVTVRLESGARVELTARDGQGRPVNGFATFDANDNDLEVVEVEQGVGQVSGLEPGTYVVQMEAQGQNAATFAPQRVEVPARGKATITFRAQEAGTR